MLILDNISYKNILKNINYSFQRGKVYGLFGSSGSGKTTLLKIIKNFLHSWSGYITYNDSPINSYDTDIGYILQESIFFPSLDIMNNLRLTKRADGEIYKLARELKVEYLLNKELDTLSGGEKQRLNILRCLLLKPSVLLMDEPLSALDHDNVGYMLQYINNIVKKENLLCIMISHNRNYLDSYDVIISMEEINKEE